MEIPQINAAITLPSDPTSPLTTEGLLGPTFTIKAFYDSGASGVLLAKETADALGVPLASGVEFGDVGVGGIDYFNVSENINIHLAPFLAPFGVGADIDNPATFTQTYNQVFTNIRAQVAQQNSDTFIGGLDVFGMPLFQGKTVTMDSRRFNGGEIEVTDVNVYNSGQLPNSVPDADFHIQTTYADFSRFTQTTGGEGPTFSENPFIGGDPLDALIPGGGVAAANTLSSIPLDTQVVASYGGTSSGGSWLYDMGAMTSIISEQQAALMGVTYSEDTLPDGTPFLEGAPLEDQFQLQVGGVGGTTTVAGFLLDTLTLPTVEGEPITYTKAPVLVLDIAVEDPDTGDQLTLAGILGMNLILPNFEINTLDLRASAFDFITFDEPSGLLGLTLNPDVVDITLPGDYNGNGVVDAADYTIWQDSFGSMDDLAADGNGNGIVDAADYTIWQDNFGNTSAASGLSNFTIIPEPASLLMVSGLGVLMASRRRNPITC
ncbi:dockerin type I repeat-containing protein [Algisphaera agarilytica]|uniref:dockerin type I repeat-containing protein n=1 Tax=Algisphaera agarilytica TaxID=1385975 RepID=UPI001C88AD7D|nr:dockerin type I repeat-containing protein [Algisphaera agarilytica]